MRNFVPVSVCIPICIKMHMVAVGMFVQFFRSRFWVAIKRLLPDGSDAEICIIFTVKLLGREINGANRRRMTCCGMITKVTKKGMVMLQWKVQMR